ncbi:MAG: hypothetical protein DI535_23335 [Citrobacter freundii]|nr:MAG: hypothetical protein DI535_23335 [Citrobacter freundii]
MSNNPFRGAFVMRSQDHHILTSTYFNINDQDPYPETAKRTAPGINPEDPFEGTFDTIWLEKKDHARMILKVTKSSDKPHYSMEWEYKGKLAWHGEAVKENGILFGYYWGVND